MVSIYRACRGSRKQMRAKKKRRGKMETSGGGDMKCSVFILVQVSLFIEVVILRRRKAFLKNRKKENYSGLKLVSLKRNGYFHHDNLVSSIPMISPKTYWKTISGKMVPLKFIVI